MRSRPARQSAGAAQTLNNVSVDFMACWLALLAQSLELYGTAKFLEQVGRAQIELMDAWLDPTTVDKAGDRNVPRGEHRCAGIYRDFYNFTFIVHSPEPLDSILKGFHAGTVGAEERRILPSFAEFRRLCRHEDLPADL